MLENLKELKSVSSRLNEASDSITVSLSQINDKLNEMNLGLTVWLDRPPLISTLVEPSRYHKKQHIYSASEMEILGYAKTKSDWGLAVQNRVSYYGEYQGDEACPFTNEVEGEIRPLLDCSRDLRVRSVELLPELLKLLKEKAEEVIMSLDKAKELASEL